MKLVLTFFVLLSLLIGAGTSVGQSTHTLWYNQPAEYFEEALSLGNGKMGACVFGGIHSEKIYLNDATLWSGKLVNAHMNPNAYKYIPLIREALANEDYKLADSVQRNIQGKFSESYAPLGTVYIDFEHTGKANKYHRELNIEDAVSKTSYTIDDLEFSREYFISPPDQVMVIKLKASRKGALNFRLRFESLLKNKITITDTLLQATGYAPVKAEPSYRGDIPNAVIFDEKRGTRFTLLSKIKNKDGQITYTDSAFCLKESTEAMIFISTSTSFNGFDKNPATEGLDN
ncbi:MAG: glycoside hydrolase family 95 protein [Calditrichaceae bacterium]|nr:glycoside hydrolase family 95 protein [Calditrichaceae bacterium]MBN2709955.1 glycoside hydrolase family 95 protein [Calditrichaceae bacterium]